MKIDTELLKEENYSNPRLIEIKNEETYKLYEEIVEMQNNIKPSLERFEQLEQDKKKINEEMEKLVAEMNEVNQKASKIKEKLVPLVEEEVMPHLGELDEFVGLEKIDGVYYAKVNDRIEEWVKSIRSTKVAK